MHVTAREMHLYLEKQQCGFADPVFEKHIRSCARCREKLGLMSKRMQKAEARQDALVGEQITVMPAESDLGRLEARLGMEDAKLRRWKIGWSPRFRIACISAGLTVVLSLAFVFPPVQALAGRFLRVFRVKQFSIIQVDPQNLQHLDQLGSSSLLAQLISDTAKVEPQGKPQETMEIAEASLLAGIQLRVPTALSEQPRWKVQPRTNITLYMDLPRIKTIFQEAGYSDVFLPEGLQDATINIDIPPIAVAYFGDCRNTREASKTNPTSQITCTVLTQLLNPSITAPGDLNTD